MEYVDVLFEKKEGVGFIKLNRPDLFNAMSPAMMEGIMAALHDCENDSSIGAVIICGEGKAFCAGGDLKSMQEQVMNIEKLKTQNIDKIAQALVAMHRFSKPIIAQIHGAAAGGGANLALNCDFRIASEDVKLIQSFVNVGLAPDTGGAYTLTRYVGVGKAMELLMTARPVLAQEALALGLLTKVVKREALEEETLAFAKLLSAKPRESIALVKTMLNRYTADRLEEELLYETMFIRLLKLTENHKEGVQAFLEKRQPVFNQTLK